MNTEKEIYFYKSHLEKTRLSKVSVKNYLADLRHFLRFIKIQGTSLTDSDYVFGYHKFLKSGKLSTSTNKRRVSSLNKYLDYLKTKGVVIPTFKPDENNNNSNLFPNLLNNYKNYLINKKASHNTIKNYLSDIRAFLIPLHNLSDINSEYADNYLSKVKVQFGSSTVLRKVSSLNTFYGFLRDNGIIQSIPASLAVKKYRFTPLSKISNYLKEYPFISFSANISVAVVLFSLFIYFTPLHKSLPAGRQAPTVLSSSTETGRVIPFSGTLTNENGSPKTDTVTAFFTLYDAKIGGNIIWSSDKCLVTPSESGDFSVNLGNTCGEKIPNNIFNDYTQVYLSAEIDNEPLSDRIAIANTGYAESANTLNGYSASASATAKTIPVINEYGELYFDIDSPKIIGRGLTLASSEFSEGSIDINPDGNGSLNLFFEGQSPNFGSGGFINATAVNLASGSLYYGQVASDTFGYNLINLKSGSILNKSFTVSGEMELELRNGDSYTKIAAGDTQFTTSSSRTIKENFKAVNLDNILDRISNTPVYTYDFIAGSKDKMGLVAEDFYKIFERGDGKSINNAEVDMAMWLGIQALDAKVKTLEEMAKISRQWETKPGDYISSNLAAVNGLFSNSITIGTDFTIMPAIDEETGETKYTDIDPLGLHDMHLMAGKVIIDTKGTVKAPEFETKQVVIASLDQKIISSDGDKITTNATAGEDIIPANTNQVEIINENIKPDSLIYVSPLSSTMNRVLFVKSKTDGKFTVGFVENIEEEVSFNWWVVQTNRLTKNR